MPQNRDISSGNDHRSQEHESFILSEFDQKYAILNTLTLTRDDHNVSIIKKKALHP